METHLLTKGEVCRYFGNLNPSTLYRQIKAGKLPRPIHVGGSSRWLRSEVEQALQAMVDGRAVS
jgi:prophage regulatory protein